VVAIARGSREVLAVLADKALGSVDDELGDLHAFLDERLGPTWVDDYHDWRHGPRDAP
jgi:hypothetical protein